MLKNTVHYCHWRNLYLIITGTRVPNNQSLGLKVQWGLKTSMGRLTPHISYVDGYCLRVNNSLRVH